jgi:RNA polymerase sigma-70 factor, ECF subfamily
VVANEAELKGLMLAGLRGDAAAHRLLLTRLSAHLRAYYKGKLARIGRGASEAEDLTQETLMAIHTRRHTYDPAQPLTPWVHAIARYKLIDHLRASEAHRADVEVEEADAVVARDDHAACESAYDLARLLGRLPAKMKQAIEAVKLEGLSVEEAARRHGMSASAVKVNVHRGMKALAALIARGRAT